VGLGLAFLAGFDAIAETSEISSVGLRVGARIIVGVFLAAVAYWYRTPSEPTSGESTSDSASESPSACASASPSPL
jgi:hypothetical protein